MHPFILLSIFVFWSGVNTASGAEWTGECKTGKHQSPIKLSQKGVVTGKHMPEPFIDNTDVIKFLNINNKHTYIIGFIGDQDKKPSIKASALGTEKNYTIEHVHFHWGDKDGVGSEHTLEGKKFSMEGHTVMYNSKFETIEKAKASKQKDALAVIGVFFEIGNAPNDKLAPVIDGIKKVTLTEGTEKGIESNYVAKFGPHIFFPRKSNMYRYYGSLTTPACNEVVLWSVWEKPIKIGKAQLETLRKISVAGKPIVNNFREVQGLNGRQVEYITAD